MTHFLTTQNILLSLKKNLWKTCEITYQWRFFSILSMNFLSMKCLYLWIFYPWNVLSMNFLSMTCPIYEFFIHEMSYLWMFYLWNVLSMNFLSMKCHIHYAMSPTPKYGKFKLKLIIKVKGKHCITKLLKAMFSKINNLLNSFFLHYKMLPTPVHKWNFNM